MPAVSGRCGDRRGIAGARIRLLQANIELGSADAAALLERVRADDVDVLTVIELTDSAVRRLAAAGLHDSLPYSYVRPRAGGGGAGIYARHPLRDGALLSGLHLHNVRATMTMPGGRDVAAYALHLHPPYPGPVHRWASDLRRLQEIFRGERLPMIAGGDVNATYDHRRYRDLLHRSAREGAGPLLDAAEYLGAGVVATYPADRWYPAILAIDRILTRGCVPLSFRRVEVPGSDHHGVSGDIGFAERGR
ncbi:endonuclease/exonuclease/phosphatase family protein [Mycobacterium sp. PS03-16]|uniref:endonuclease/exonuclease/phosphatase family protein n=1 Tax=Mycobacterium sp. PS03-16 TaxID=2559611 RepID=UPI001FD863EB|nr:endonuclease/exonuclease/phosphatase family protein [Mycobacterium sp. PS03-16]